MNGSPDLVGIERVTACQRCGSDALRPWRPCEDRMYGLTSQLFRYSRCLGCGLVQLTVRPRAEDVGRLYPEEYEPYAVPQYGAPSEPAPDRDPIARVLGGIAARLAGRMSSIAHRDLSPAHAGDRALDFGCGSPQSLRRLAASGWRPLGCDFSPLVVGQVREAGFDAILADEVQSEVSDSSLGLVQLNHVLEHVYDLEGTITMVASKLRPGGLLHIALPNPGGISSILLRDHWLALEPRHITLPSPSIVVDMLQGSFSRIEVVQEPVGKDLARSVHYRRVARRGLGERGVAGVLEDRRLMAACSLVGAAAGILGRADRFRVFAWR